MCSHDRDIGPCRGRFRKWYYERRTRSCKEFTFGGCEGNGNRFSSKEECETVCVVLDEPLIRYGSFVIFILRDKGKDPVRSLHVGVSRATQLVAGIVFSLLDGDELILSS